MHGACLVLRGPEFWSPEQAVAALSAHGITRLDVPPAYATELATWVRARGTAMALRTCTVGGEAVARASFTLLQHACQPATLLNAYGPTEAVITPLVWVAADTGCTTAYAPIGKTVGERTAYILDAALRVVPVGVVGELYIGGAGLARGYHGQPGLTAERFVPDPFSVVSGGRLYRTGDLARWQADGTIEYVGRVDDQVKIRGFRIEPGEIEAVLQAHAAITAAAVVARDAGPGAGQAIGPGGGSSVGSGEAFHDTRLVAYLVTNQNPPPSHSELRSFLHEKLPDYMVPALFVRLDALPLAPNGKVDRRALPVPESWRPESEAEYVAPRTEMQRIIATIWQEILHVEQVGIHDNFFDLGGHSLLMTKVWHTLCTRLHKDLAMLDLFQYPTIHALATHLSQEHQAQHAPQLADDLDDKIQAGKSRLKQQLLQRQRATHRGLANA
jgi:acyl-CoA synthetase (AMP-forming)/AMP-acid ligase II